MVQHLLQPTGSSTPPLNCLNSVRNIGTISLFDADVANEMYSLKDGQWHNMGKDAPTQWKP
ncbi:MULTISPECIES: hypothetical protein [Kitasatospora]|uniref:Uncharacterized protein n=1 Tax=Kitasatospora cathayae TaxID=3004092 RepID=A0ABY7QF02_9ACTN|nr:hypothetical protein [Kitasatospora sp. HUAS 3-15]WBP91334.1 hypothetical protein O1G21_39275 [Kitasatospora sp. HUAS 3-15]